MLNKVAASILFLFSLSSVAQNMPNDLMNRAANLPESKLQIGFANAKDLQHFTRRFESHHGPRRLIDLANVRFGDLDLDLCLTTKEYNLFLAAQNQWENADVDVKRTQVMAYFTPWYWEQMNVKGDAYTTISQLAKNETSLDWLVLFQGSAIRSQWAQPDGLLTDEKAKTAEREWTVFRNLKSTELDRFANEKLKDVKTCTPAAGPVKSQSQVKYIDSARGIYDAILPKLDEIKTPGQWSGKAGVAAFIGVLSGLSGNPEMREQAHKLLTEARGLNLKSKDTSFLEGAPGIAMAALTVYKVTRDQRFLEIALERGEAAKLNEFNEQAYGTAGIGLTTIALYRETKDAKWLKKSEEAALALKNTGVSRRNMTWWPMGSVFPSIFAGFGHGSAGIGYFLMKLYEETGKKEYLQLAERAAQHVLNTAHENADGLHWTWYQPPIGYGSIWKYQWSHGNFGIAYLFESLSRNTKATKWKVALEKTLRPAIKEGDTFGYDDGGQCCGKAGQGDLWVELYRLTKQEKYLVRAKETAKFLIDQEGRAYLKFGRTPKEYPLGYNGLSGIGLFLLQLHSPDKMFLPFQ